MRAHVLPRKRSRGKNNAGLTLIEVSIGMVVAAGVLLFSAVGLSSNLRAVNQAESTTRAAVFLETVMEDIHTQPYDNLLALNGNRLFDNTDATDSWHMVDLTVFLAAVDRV